LNAPKPIFGQHQTERVWQSFHPSPQALHSLSPMLQALRKHGMCERGEQTGMLRTQAPHSPPMQYAVPPHPSCMHCIVALPSHSNCLAGPGAFCCNAAFAGISATGASSLLLPSDERRNIAAKAANNNAAASHKTFCKNTA